MKMSKLALVATFAGLMLTSFSTLPTHAQSQVTQVDTQCGRTNCEGGGSPDTTSCGEQLGVLKRVLPAEVLGVNNSYRVWVTEFCPSSSLMRSDGNAAYLRTAIAKNGVLTEMLQRHGFQVNDVFAVKMMGDDTINLYVHNF
jgi:hypothetical protein